MTQITLYSPGKLRNYVTRYVLPMLSVKNLLLPTVGKKNPLCKHLGQLLKHKTLSPVLSLFQHHHMSKLQAKIYFSHLS